MARTHIMLPMVLLLLGLLYTTLFGRSNWKHGAEYLDREDGQSESGAAAQQQGTPPAEAQPGHTASGVGLAQQQQHQHQPSSDGDRRGSPVLTAYWSQEPWDSETPQFTMASFVFMSLYCEANGYRYRYYIAPEAPPVQREDPTLPEGCGAKEYCRHGKAGGCHSRACVGPRGCLLHPVWCKVKAARQALVDFPDAPLAIMLDTDAIVNFEFFSTDLLGWVRGSLNQPLETAPMGFNQQNPSWWHVFVGNHNNTKNHKGTTYNWVINTGMFLVGNTERGRSVVDTWWNSSMGDYGDNPLKWHFRDEWPWEQDRAMALANEWRVPGVQVFPSNAAIAERPWRDMAQAPGTCMAATASFRCIVNHFCGGYNMKVQWGGRVMYFSLAIIHVCTTGRALNLTVPAGEEGAVRPFFPQTYLIEPTARWCSDLVRSAPGVFPPVTAAPNFTTPEVHAASVARLQNAAKHFSRFVVELP